MPSVPRPIPSHAHTNTSQTLQKHYLRIQRLWPSDALRNVTFAALISKRLETRFLDPAAHPEKSISSTATNTAQVHPVPPTVDAEHEREELNAMYSLLENRYSKQV